MGAYQKGNRWYIDYYLPDGRRKREVVTVPGVDPESLTRNDAYNALHVRKAQLAEGKFDIIKTKKQTIFDKIAEDFIEHYSKVSKKSWKRDVTSTKSLLKYFGGKSLSTITSWQCEKYKSERIKDISKRGTLVSQATVNRELACLKTMLNFAVDQGLIGTNPMRKVKLFRENPKNFRTVTDEEFKKVYINAFESLKPILIMAINTGMRRGEILSLKWENVKLDKGYILVDETKNNEQRYIPINEVLKKHLKSVKLNACCEYVFTHNGKTFKSIRTTFDTALLKSGVEKFRFHDLRHTFASRLVMNGVDLVTVQELMGHKSLSMTKRYSHPTPDHKKHAVESLNAGTMDTYLDTKPNNPKSESNVSTLNH